MGTVLVGVDGSEPSIEAAEIAAGLAAAGGDELVVLVAHLPAAADKNAATNIAGRVASRLERANTQITATAREGKPAKVLLDEAERRSARLIVLGNRRMQGPGRVLGSVANEVAHHAPCDVYVAKTT